MGEQVKIKVYELSRELNLKDADLLEIIASLEIGASSKFSSLKYEDVEKIKTYYREHQGPAVVEKRIASGAVRRRRKAAKPAPVEVPVAGEAPAEELPAEEVLPESAAKQAAEEVSVPEQEVLEPVAEEVAAESTAAEEEIGELEVEPVPPAGEVTVEPEVSAADEVKPETPPAPEAVEKSAKGKAKGARVIGRIDLEKLEKKTAGPGRQRPVREAAKPAAGTRQRPAAAAPDVVAQPEVPIEAKKIGRKGKKKAEVVEEQAVDGRRKKQSLKKSVIKDLDQLDGAGMRGRGRGKKAKGGKKLGQQTEITTPKESKRVVKITDVVSVGELAKRLGVKASEVIARLMGLGIMTTINQMIDIDTAELIASEYGHSVENVAFDEQILLEQAPDEEGSLQPRPPVVTVMGHVDHGKTSLLDAIRETSVADREAGGITQHIGAYSVELPKGRISFVDTPGHEAFTTMRSRGASITDIVILVVAADDGVMPQTIESINHARAAQVPIIVAVNKIDKANAQPDEVKRQLSEHGIVAEDWGGDAIFVEVSAKKLTNIDTLLEMVLLQAEMMELKANPDKAGKGVVLESRLDKGKGPVATVLVKEGTLRAGDYIVAGLYSGRIRALIDDRGVPVDTAGPSIPVEILGLSGVPSAGDDFNVVKSEKIAKELADNRQHQFREREISKTSKISLEDLFEQIQEGEVEKLNVIVKADVQGSLEAVTDSLKKLSTDKVKVEPLHAAVGGIKEADVMLASASNAIIIGFNVRPDMKAQMLAEQEQVDLRMYSIIYDLIDNVKKAMEGLLQPEIKEIHLGRAEVKEVFSITKIGTIAGCRVTDGKISRNAGVRLLRDDVVVYEGKISSLKRFKDDVKEVLNGYECGIGIEKYNDLKVGDVIEAYTTEEVAATL
ncbi:MAG: translation initiation factor IF-2 [Deltaproteobacteria bacterium]|nr:translation initiation factor IF-2 [Candidatus Anaeroferrophillus wilburensis]MBN2888920.1 translation initiation factor IF-2 [Deltaproteobacteria bacterium]